VAQDEREAGGGRQAFGPRLRALREAAGLSQTSLAGDGLSASYVSHLEAGRREPTEAVLRVLSDRLGVPVADLRPESRPDRERDVVLAEAALGLGNAREALEVVGPWRERLTVEALAADPVEFRLGVAVATALEHISELDDALTLLDRLRAASLTASSRVPWLGVIVALIRICARSGDSARAVDVGEQAVARADALGIPATGDYVSLVSTLSFAYWERGDARRSQALLDDLLERMGQDADPVDRAKILWNAATNAADHGDAGEGLRLADEAVTLMTRGGDRNLAARVRSMRAWAMLRQQPPLAAEARAELRAILPELRQHSGEFAVANAENELARCELILGRPDVAARHATSALRKYGLEYAIERGEALALLGSASLALGRTDEGLALLEDAARSLDAAAVPREAASAWYGLAEVYRGLGRTDAAMDAMGRALAATTVQPLPLGPLAPAPGSTRTPSPSGRRRTHTPA